MISNQKEHIELGITKKKTLYFVISSLVYKLKLSPESIEYIVLLNENDVKKIHSRTFVVSNFIFQT